jgi:hypothetical protein
MFVIYSWIYLMLFNNLTFDDKTLNILNINI